MATPTSIEYNGYTSVLVRYEDGQPALWVTDEYQAGKSDTPGTYTLNDINTGIPVGAGEDLDEAVAEWKRSVEWSEEPSA